MMRGGGGEMKVEKDNEPVRTILLYDKYLVLIAYSRTEQNKRNAPNISLRIT